jgi:hypothetical protein
LQLARLTIPTLHARQGGSRSNESTGIHAKTFTPARVWSCQETKLNRSARTGSRRLGNRALDPAVALRVGKRLQENMADFHVVDPLDQPVDILGLLGRIGIVNVVEIDVHDAHGIVLLNLADRTGKRLERRIAGDQQTGNVARVLRPQPVLQGKGQLVTLLSGDGERRTVGGTVGQTQARGALPVTCVIFQSLYERHRRSAG